MKIANPEGIPIEKVCLAVSHTKPSIFINIYHKMINLLKK